MARFRRHRVAIESGRPRIDGCLSAEAQARIRHLHLQTDSVPAAYLKFIHEPLCPPQLREWFKGYKNGQGLPLSLQRAAYVTPEMRAKFRGPKTLQLSGYTRMRDMSEIMPDGTRRDILPGDWWEFDDMSVNTPFWYEASCPVCGANGARDRELRKPGRGCDKAAHRWGRTTGRQTLWAFDLASRMPLGVDFIMRPRDAYRAEDVLRFMRRLMELHGMPRRGVRLERGIWKSRRITGHEVEASGGGQDPLTLWGERPEDVAEAKALIGGLQALGLEVDYCWSPHQKGMIESSFNHIQKLAQTSEALNIGRYAGEFEGPAKVMRSIQGGHRDPAATAVYSVERAADLYTDVIQEFALQHKGFGSVRLEGVPDELWRAHNPPASGHELGFTGREIPADKLYVFLPEVADVSIRGGNLTTKHDHEPLQWCNPELFARLGSGYRLSVRFDPTEPYLGAALFNRETGARNRDRYKLGEYIGTADRVPPAPQVTSGVTLLSPMEEAANTHQKRWSKAVSSHFRAVVGGKVRQATEDRGRQAGVLRTKSGAGVPDGVEVHMGGASAEARRALGGAPAEAAPKARKLPKIKTFEELLQA